MSIFMIYTKILGINWRIQIGSNVLLGVVTGIFIKINVLAYYGDFVLQTIWLLIFVTFQSYKDESDLKRKFLNKKSL